jgi:hypothetical protein
MYTYSSGENFPTLRQVANSGKEVGSGGIEIPKALCIVLLGLNFRFGFAVD